MHYPYRLMVLIFAAVTILAQGPDDRMLEPGPCRSEVEKGCDIRSMIPSSWSSVRAHWRDYVAVVPSYDRLQQDVDRIKNDILGKIEATLKTPTPSMDGTPGKRNPDDLWRHSYADAMTAAELRSQMLLIYFCDTCEDSPCSRFKMETLDNAKVRSKLRDYVCVQLPLCTKITVDGREETLSEYPAFQEMLGRPGIAIVDFRSPDPTLHGAVVSAFPITEKMWYTPQQMAVILELPSGTLTQRTLIYAVRIHPEKPASANGQLSPFLLQEAESHSRHQADIRLQGHHQWGTRFQRIVGRLPGGVTAREVCAESWPGENLVEAAIECVRCWRLSLGHWSSVRARHASYGYDMRRGSNRIWYATGIFGKR